MAWEEVEDLHRITYKKEFVDCTNEEERAFLINLLKKIMPERSEAEIDRALGYACRKLENNWRTKEMLNTVKENIGLV